MILEARQKHCFSSRHLLSLDGRPIGLFQGEWFGEDKKIRLRNRMALEFRNQAVLGRDFCLLNVRSKSVVAYANLVQWIPARWELAMSVGLCELRGAGWLTRSMVLLQDGVTVADVDDIAHEVGGWRVIGNALTLEDLLMVGLLFQTLRNRKREATT